jgi:hypothetical protein
VTWARSLKIAFAAAIVLVAETTLFHALLYVRDFFAATAVIGHAVIGVALGALVASRVRCRESILFASCCGGTALGIWLAAFAVARYPALPLVAAATALCVAFPMAYVATMFRDHPGPRVYLSDMAGAAFGAVATAGLYEILGTESIALALAVVVPLVGAVSLAPARDAGRGLRIGGAAAGVLLAAAGATALVLHLQTDALNLFRIFDRESPFAEDKMLQKASPEKLIRSYDSLVGRIDVVRVPPPRHNDLSYNGYSADHFKREKNRTWADLKAGQRRWPSTDQRVFYGHAKEPSFYIIGSAGRGILHTVKKLTPADRIVPVEIDPSVVELMTRDFFEESGRAYGGLTPVVGNALSLLRGLERDFDSITLMNTHPSRTIGFRTGPDSLHTLESYRLYLDRLSKRGVLNIEERPFSRSGMLATYRELHTLWHAVAERGSADPSRHFFIWDWDAASFPKVDLRYGKQPGVYRDAESYFIAMIVSKRPLVGATLDRALAWYVRGAGVCRPLYLKGIFEDGEVADVFRMIEKDDFSALAPEGFDPRLATSDSPFVSMSTRHAPEVSGLVRFSAVVFAAIALLVGAILLRRARRRRALGLVAFNALTGFGYFFVEVMLMQVYQSVYVSPSWAFVLTLGALLLGSGVGGFLCLRIRPLAAVVLLAALALVAVRAPAFALAWNVPHTVTMIAGVVLIAATGFALGVFFPRGLAVAEAWGLKAEAPLCFALNAAAGAFAVAIALWTGVVFGYSATLAAAIVCYGAATWMLDAWSHP